MIRLFIIACSIFTLSSFALIDENMGKKKIETEHGIEHPDHIPHNHQKDPLKKIGNDDGSFPRKRKKLRTA